jgi:hypothetical protein
MAVFQADLAGSVLAKDEALKSMWREGSARP